MLSGLRERPPAGRAGPGRRRRAPSCVLRQRPGDVGQPGDVLVERGLGLVEQAAEGRRQLAEPGHAGAELLAAVRRGRSAGRSKSSMSWPELLVVRADLVEQGGEVGASTLLMSSCRPARSSVITAVCLNRLSTVPDWPWKTCTIEADSLLTSLRRERGEQRLEPVEDRREVEAGGGPVPSGWCRRARSGWPGVLPGQQVDEALTEQVGVVDRRRAWSSWAAGRR